MNLVWVIFRMKFKVLRNKLGEMVRYYPMVAIMLGIIVLLIAGTGWYSYASFESSIASIQHYSEMANSVLKHYFEFTVFIPGIFALIQSASENTEELSVLETLGAGQYKNKRLYKTEKYMSIILGFICIYGFMLPYTLLIFKLVGLNRVSVIGMMIFHIGYIVYTVMIFSTAGRWIRYFLGKYVLRRDDEFNKTLTITIGILLFCTFVWIATLSKWSGYFRISHLISLAESFKMRDGTFLQMALDTTNILLMTGLYVIQSRSVLFIENRENLNPFHIVKMDNKWLGCHAGVLLKVSFRDFSMVATGIAFGLIWIVGACVLKASDVTKMSLIGYVMVYVYVIPLVVIISMVTLKNDEIIRVVWQHRRNLSKYNIIEIIFFSIVFIVYCCVLALGVMGVCGVGGFDAIVYMPLDVTLCIVSTLFMKYLFNVQASDWKFQVVLSVGAYALYSGINMMAAKGGNGYVYEMIFCIIMMYGVQRYALNVKVTQYG